MRSLPVAAALALVACNTGFDPQYRVADLRILAVRAQVEGGTNADVYYPGDVLRLEALVANPLARAPLQVSWYACAPAMPGIPLPPCLDPQYQRDPVGLFAQAPYAGRVWLVASGEIPPPVPLADLPQELVLPIVAALDARIRLIERESTYACQLYVEVPLVVVAQAEERREVALKTVRAVPTAEMLALTTLRPELADDYVLNANPAVDDVVSDPSDRDGCTGGTPVGSALPAGKTVLCGRAPLPGSAGAPQDFWQCGPEDPVTRHPERTSMPEELSWQWYVTAGTFPEVGGEGNAVGDSIELERPAEGFTLWSILRDGRGGVAWTRRDLAPAP